MFESSVVESKVQPRNPKRLTVLPLSIVAHVALIGGAVFASIWHVELPTQSPSQIAFPVMNPPPPQIPQPPPPPASHAAPATAPHASVPAPAPIQPPAPQSIPDSIPLVPSTPDLPSGPDHVIGPSTSGSPDSIVGTGPSGSSGQTGSEISGPLHVGNGVNAPIVIRRVDPRYPNLLLRTGMAGTVVLQCIVDRNGEIQSVEVLTSPNKLFEQSAVDAVRQWKFKAGSLGGRPVATIFELTVHFESKR